MDSRSVYEFWGLFLFWKVLYLSVECWWECSGCVMPPMSVFFSQWVHYGLWGCAESVVSAEIPPSFMGSETFGSFCIQRPCYLLFSFLFHRLARAFLYSSICLVIIPGCLCFRQGADSSQGCRLNLALGSNLTLCATPSSAEASKNPVGADQCSWSSVRNVIFQERVRCYNGLTNLVSDLCEFGNGIN